MGGPFAHPAHRRLVVAQEYGVVEIKDHAGVSAKEPFLEIKTASGEVTVDEDDIELGGIGNVSKAIELHGDPARSIMQPIEKEVADGAVPLPIRAIRTMRNLPSSLSQSRHELHPSKPAGGVKSALSKG
jgi:hypothetical protein